MPTMVHFNTDNVKQMTCSREMDFLKSWEFPDWLSQNSSVTLSFISHVAINFWLLKWW